MKKKIAVAAIIAGIIAVLIICMFYFSRVTCYFCDKKAICTSINFIGKKVNICKDCKEDYDSIPTEIRDMFIGK